AAELAARVEDGQHDLERRLALLLVLGHGDPTTVVVAADPAVVGEGDRDRVAVPGARLDDRGIDDLVDGRWEAARAGRADVHPRPLAHRLEPLENLNFIRTVGVRDLFTRGLARHEVIAP